MPADFTSTVSIVFTPAADEDVDAEFTFQVATVSDGDGDDGDLGTSTTTVVASYTLSLGQTHSATSGP